MLQAHKKSRSLRLEIEGTIDGTVSISSDKPLPESFPAFVTTYDKEESTVVVVFPYVTADPVTHADARKQARDLFRRGDCGGQRASLVESTVSICSDKPLYGRFTAFVVTTHNDKGNAIVAIFPYEAETRIKAETEAKAFYTETMITFPISPIRLNRERKVPT
jgi:hypothetical protein